MSAVACTDVETIFKIGVCLGLLWGALIGCACGLAMRPRRNRLNFDPHCENMQ